MPSCDADSARLLFFYINPHTSAIELRLNYDREIPEMRMSERRSELGTGESAFQRDQTFPEGVLDQVGDAVAVQL